MRLKGYISDRETETYLTMFKMCEALGFSLDDLGVPKKEQPKVIDAFKSIIIKRGIIKGNKVKTNQLLRGFNYGRH